MLAFIEQKERLKFSRAHGLIIASIVFCFSFGSCYYDVEEILYPSTSGCDSLNVSYQMGVLPILESNCYLCHNKNTRLGDLNLESFDTLRMAALSGVLLSSLKHEIGFSAMPKDRNKLNNCDLAILDNWVKEGAKKN